jgi:hypothetical protein
MELSKEQILQELRNNPKAMAYLAEFEPLSVDSFLDSYAQKKFSLLQRGESLRQKEGSAIQYYSALAEDLYDHIFHKKLFNLQCLWRADQTELPIEVAYEFNYWSDNVRACPFIEDVTEKELEAMLHYIEIAPYDFEYREPWDWQAYDEFKDESTGIGAGENYPDWYEVYDNYMGTQHLMTLPDLKGAREQQYISAWWADKKALLEANAPKKPFMSCHSESTEAFIRAVEPYKILDYFRLNGEEEEREYRMEQLRYELERLMEESQEVWVPQGKFPDAVFQASHNLKAMKVKTLLPQVHEDHLERKAIGITYELSNPFDKDELVKEIRERMREGKRRIDEGDL